MPVPGWRSMPGIATAKRTGDRSRGGCVRRRGGAVIAPHDEHRPGGDPEERERDQGGERKPDAVGQGEG
jgi:hypothetical protein